MYFVKYENPEGEHLKVAKAEAPPQTPPAWPRLAHQDRTALTPTVEAVSLREKRNAQSECARASFAAPRCACRQKAHNLSPHGKAFPPE